MAVRIGFIGCGYVAESHLRNLKDNPDVELAAFCGSRDFNKVKAITQEHGGTPYADHKEMLDKARLDAVYILLPPFLHGQIEKDCAERGIHMLIEKPIALDMKTARMVQEAIEKNKVICSVGYHWRYSSITDRVNDLLKDKEIGMVEGHWCSYFPEGSDWWSRKEKSGGQIMEQTTHLFDLARYFVGEVEKVYCEADLRLLKDFKNVNVEDGSAVTLRFKNGVIGVMISRCSRSPLEINLKIIAEDMVLTHSNHKLEIWQNDESRKTEDISEGEYSLSFKEENRVFIEAVKTGKADEIRSPYQDAVKTLALTLAVENSREKTAPVSL